MSIHRKVHGKRSFTGNHPLLPAMRPTPVSAPIIPKVPTYTFLKWTFGRGSVIWKIWPAVLLHSSFAAAIVYIWTLTGSTIDIPNVMLTVMGVVIGFVISYRAMSGYDRYWLGRTTWSDVIRNARTMGRLVWYHVPPRLTGGIVSPVTIAQSGAEHTDTREFAKVMAEKRMALDLIEAFAVALKHHLRGELGIYYEDLYDLVRPLHDFATPAQPSIASARLAPTSSPSTLVVPPTASSSGVSTASGSSTPKPTTHAARRPAYTARPTAAAAATAGDSGTGSLNLGSIDTHSSASLLDASVGVSTSNANLGSAHPSTTSLPHQPLLPASNPAPEDGVLRRVRPDVIPFAGLLSEIARWLGSWRRAKKDDFDGHKHGDRSSRRQRAWSGPIHPAGVAQLEEVEMGENLPEEVLRCLSEWFSVLEARGTVPGTSLGAMIAGIQTFETSLTTLEQVLTTPLPFVYSVHIRVVWLYLFLLPFQLVSDFKWHTVPAVSVGAFVYLGFVAAGEEIEQPFGYDDNDLDLDMFCRDIIRTDIRCLKKARCLNAWFPPVSAALPAVHLQRSNTTSSSSSGPSHGGYADTGASMRSRKTLHAHVETVPPHIASDVADPYGGNMYRASLASLADSVSLEQGSVEDYDDDSDRMQSAGDGQDSGSGLHTETVGQDSGNSTPNVGANGSGNDDGDRNGNLNGQGEGTGTGGGVREGQLVDLR